MAAIEAPPAGVTIVGERPPAAPPAPTTTIQVSQMPKPANSPAPAKKGSGMDRVRGELGKIAKDSSGAPIPPETPAPKPKPAAAPEPGSAATDSGSPAADAPEAGTATAGEPAAPKGKVSPWKLYEAEKVERAKLAKELQDVRAQLVPEAERKTLTEKMTGIEKRAQELEDHIRFVDYSKSQEFLDKYQKPYEQAWNRAGKELRELTVADPNTGQPRPFGNEDMLTLVNLSLPEARKLANEVYGDFADDVMAHRKEIRNLFDQQSDALTEAKKTGLAKVKEMQETQQRQAGEIQQTVKATWDKVNAEALADPKYGKFFQPIEGDEQGNQRLAKGYKLVDRAFTENPQDPRLTPEQRASVVKRHAAVRNRAAGFGRLSYQNGQLEAKVAELTKKLAEYEASTPAAGGTAAPAAGAELTGMSRVRAALAKIAKPA